MARLLGFPRLRAALRRVRPLVAFLDSLRATPSLPAGLVLAAYRTLVWLVDATRFSRRLSVAVGGLTRRIHVTLRLRGPADALLRVSLPVQPQAWWTLYEVVFAQVYRPLSALAPAVVVDAGANIGLSSVYLHALYPAARFVCVEADPRNLALLERNLRQNGVAADVIPAALAAASGTITFRMHRAASDYSSTGRSCFPESEFSTVEVPATTLAELLDARGVARVGLLKIDVEGAEFDILGDTSAIARLDYVTGEFHGFAGDVDALAERVCRAARLVVLRRSGDASLATFHLGPPG